MTGALGIISHVHSGPSDLDVKWIPFVLIVPQSWYETTLLS